MPLIIVTGLPTSGKTTRAKQLAAYIESRIASSAPSAPASRYRLHVVSDDALSIPRSVYDLSLLPAHARSANAGEKDARAAAYGAVKRVLSERDIVILDGMNYIKGWRYQLFCEAKAVRTPSVVLQIGCGVERAKAVNEERLKRRKERTMIAETTEDVPSAEDGSIAKGPEGDANETENGEKEEQTEEEDLPEGYEPQNWVNLVFRYEEPNPMTRWDSPLFALVWDDDEERARQVFDSLWDAIAGEARKVVRPNQATVQRGRDASEDYLYVLERETQDIAKVVLEKQGDEGGGEVRIPKSGVGGGGDDGDDLVVELPGEKVSFPRMQRLRRAFIGLSRGGIGLEGVGNLMAGRIRESFVGYLNDAFERHG